jgi:hypothetical protein
MEKSQITVRDLRVLRNRGRVTANVSFSRYGGEPFAAGVELDLGREDVKAAVDALETLVVTEFMTTLANVMVDSRDEEPEPAKKAPRKRASRVTRHI